MPASTQNAPQNVMNKIPQSHACIDLNHPMPARTQNASQHVLSIPLICLRWHKMNLNICWPNLSHANEDTKRMSPSFDQAHPMSARSQYVSKHSLNKPLPCHRARKMHINMCWQNPTHISENTKYYQQALTILLSCQRAMEMHINLCWPNPTDTSENTQSISTCVDQS